MRISCNLINKFISYNQPIDWVNIWNKFTMTTAEVESIEQKGKSISDVVIAKVLAKALRCYGKYARQTV